MLASGLSLTNDLLWVGKGNYEKKSYTEVISRKVIFFFYNPHKC